MRTSGRAGWLARICTPAVLVGTLSLAAVVAIYWYMASRPGTNPALVPTPRRSSRRCARKSRAGILPSTRSTRDDFRASLEYQVKFFMDLGQIKTAPDLSKAIVTELL